MHKQAITRKIQIDAKPIISLQYLLELQTGLIEIYKAVIDLAVKYRGPYGITTQYAREMLKTLMHIIKLITRYNFSIR